MPSLTRAATVAATALFTLLPLTSAAQTEPPAAEIEPDAVLSRSREALVGLRSIQSQIVQNVALGDRRFRATGRYLQGTDLKLRLELEIKTGGSEGLLLEVCDGQVLWTQQTVKTPGRGDGESRENVRLTRRDVGEILKAAAPWGNNPRNILMTELGLGGLPALLASIERSMEFDAAREEVIDGESFTVIEGTWNDETRDRWRSVLSDSRQLPEHIPDRVRLYFGERDFPRRIQYLKKDRITDVVRPMVTLDFVDVVLDAAVDEREFEYKTPRGVYEEDVTDRYIRQLRQSAVAERRSAAAPSGAAPRGE